MQMLSICKNIYAILMGMFWAKYQSQNTQYAVFTNICKELFKTFDSAIFSYAGIGDLCLTATQAKSRNFQYGMALINKKAVAHATVEGVTAASYLLDHSCKRLPCNKKLPLLFKTAQLIAKPENIASELIKIFNQLG
jgi:glycerol-3-phosphate dehydrogenase (NAD(P)+)